MEKGLLFLTLSMFCLWAILDEFFGGQKISAVAARLAPGGGVLDGKPSLGDSIPNTQEENKKQDDILKKPNPGKDYLEKPYVPKNPQQPGNLPGNRPPGL